MCKCGRVRHWAFGFGCSLSLLCFASVCLCLRWFGFFQLCELNKVNEKVCEQKKKGSLGSFDFSAVPFLCKDILFTFFVGAC